MLDMLRFEIDPNGVFNVTEFGTVKDPAQFRALFAYSPYQHVRDGTKYPAVFLSTGENDGRVNPDELAQDDRAPAGGDHVRAAGLPHHDGRRGPRHRQPARACRSTRWRTIIAFLFDQLGMTLP